MNKFQPIKMQFGVYTLLLAIPYILMQLDILPKENTPVVIFSILSLGVCFMYTLITNLNLKLNLYSFAAHFALCVVVLTVIAVDLSSNSYEFEEIALNANAVVALIYTFVVYVLFSKSKITEESIDGCIKSIIAVGVVFCIANLVINFRDILSVAQISGVYNAKFASFFLGRNQFGSFLYLSLIALFYHMLKHKNKYNYFILVLFLLNLLLTFSRAAILAAAIFVFIATFNISLNKRVWVYFGIALICVALLSNDTIFDIFNRFLLRKDVATAGRSERWFDLLAIVGDKPQMIFGLSASGLKRTLIDIGVKEIDNAYLDFLFSYGIIIFLSYITMLLSVIVNAVKLFRRKLKTEGLYALAAIFSFFVYSFFESFILIHSGLQQWIALFVILILPMNTLKTEVANNDSSDSIS